MISLSTDIAPYRRMIKCPVHYVLKPGGQPFVMERDPRFLNIKEADAKIFKLNIWRKKKDRFGRPIQNWSDYYQPPMSQGFLRENVYRVDSPFCQKCRKCVTK